MQPCRHRSAFSGSSESHRQCIINNPYADNVATAPFDPVLTVPWPCRGVLWNWREVCCLRIPTRRPEPLLTPDMEMGYTDQQESIPALSGLPPYYPGTLQQPTYPCGGSMLSCTVPCHCMMVQLWSGSGGHALSCMIPGQIGSCWSCTLDTLSPPQNQQNRNTLCGCGGWVCGWGKGWGVMGGALYVFCLSPGLNRTSAFIL